jgi:septal ring factor EnvC (AmiA/AmiB activator)
MSSSGVLPNPKTSTAAAYRAKAKALLDSAKAEYCFYHVRYKASLDHLFAGIRGLSTGSDSAELRQVVEKRLAKTQTLNRKLNDLIQIMNKVTEKLMNSSNTLQEEIVRFTTTLRNNKEKLEKQNQVIQSNEASMRLQKQMVKYTEEKSRYSDNLLKMYSFLNIVALGLLVYVYKAAGEE